MKVGFQEGAQWLAVAACDMTFSAAPLDGIGVTVAALRETEIRAPLL